MSNPTTDMRTGRRNARAAVAKDAEKAAPIPMDTMEATGASITLQGHRLNIFPLTIGDKPALDAALRILGDEYLIPALAEDNPEGLARVTKMNNPDAPDLNPEDITVALRLVHAGLSEVQTDAMLDICEMAFNPVDFDAMSEKVFDRLTARSMGEDDPTGLDTPIIPRKRIISRGMIACLLTPRAFPTILRTALDLSGLNP